MISRYLYAGVVALAVATPAYADPPKGFEEFRKGLMENFNSFRNRILDHYADFLAGEWHEYESLEPLERYSEPKPSEIPSILEFETEEADEQKKEVMLSLGFENVDANKFDEKKDPALLNWMRGARSLYSASAAPAGETIVGEDVRDKLAPGNIVTGNGLVANYDGDIFNFYGMEFGLPKVNFEIENKIVNLSDFAVQWKKLESQNVGKKLVPGIQAVQKSSGLSDYLVFEMIMAYADHKFPEANDAAKMAFAHYILCQMEFGARLAVSVEGDPYMLLPFEEPVYGCGAVNLDRRYYVFSAPGRPFVKRSGFYTPDLPTDASFGKSLGLRLAELRLPMNPYHFSFEHAGLKIEGDMNQNIIPMLYRYPQMHTKGFAESTITPELRDEVVRQVKDQLKDQDPLKAADKLLALLQYGFSYKTDDNYHGFEKPYFFEEILFYPHSDCEDRAIFYSYLLWNALGIETDLIAYPNHEATAIKAEKVWGGFEHYKKGQDKFFISDPTFQGAPTGSCMPQCKDVLPTIDVSYSSNM